MKFNDAGALIRDDALEFLDPGPGFTESFTRSGEVVVFLFEFFPEVVDDADQFLMACFCDELGRSQAGIP